MLIAIDRACPSVEKVMEEPFAKSYRAVRGQAVDHDSANDFVGIETLTPGATGWRGEDRNEVDYNGQDRLFSSHPVPLAPQLCLYAPMRPQPCRPQYASAMATQAAMNGAGEREICLF
jgi:hypothetical protein